MLNWGLGPGTQSIVERYLSEARICLNQQAYRMSVIASACALNFGLDLVLRHRNLVNKTRLLDLNEAIEEIEKQNSDHSSKMLSEVSIEKCKKVMHYRNAFAHPEDYLELKPSSRSDYYVFEPKFGTVPEKKQAYQASQLDLKKALRAMAEESLEITCNSINDALKNWNLP